MNKKSTEGSICCILELHMQQLDSSNLLNFWPFVRVFCIIRLVKRWLTWALEGDEMTHYLIKYLNRADKGIYLGTVNDKNAAY